VTAHAEALASLQSWAPPSPEQATLRDEYVSHLASYPEALARSCAPGHLTAGALVLSAELDSVLLNLHGRAGRWFAFGGHWEPGDDSLLATASREAAEESGVRGLAVDPEPVHLDRHRVGFCRGHDRTDHLDVRYAALAPHGAQPHVSDESIDVRWWSLASLPELGAEMHELIELSHDRLAAAQSRPGSSRAAVE
jgi:8-oxo-dGTP pyrophosphatase MutT (NUDIX family)